MVKICIFHQAYVKCMFRACHDCRRYYRITSFGAPHSMQKLYFRLDNKCTEIIEVYAGRRLRRLLSINVCRYKSRLNTSICARTPFALASSTNVFAHSRSLWLFQQPWPLNLKTRFIQFVDNANGNAVQFESHCKLNKRHDCGRL